MWTGMKIPSVMAKPQHRRQYSPIPTLLRQAREGQDWSQQTLASKLRWPQSKIHKSEDGSRRVDFGEFVEWMLACEKDPRKELDLYLAAAYPGGKPRAGYPDYAERALTLREGEDADAKERKIASLLEQAAALLKKDHRKGARKGKSAGK